jgi:hypothetical protein
MHFLKAYFYSDSEHHGPIRRQGWVTTTPVTIRRELSPFVRATAAAFTGIAGLAFTRWVLRLQWRGQLIGTLGPGVLCYRLARCLFCSEEVALIERNRVEIIQKAFTSPRYDSPAIIDSINAAEQVTNTLEDKVVQILWNKWIVLMQNHWVSWRQHPLDQLNSDSLAKAQSNQVEIAYHLLEGKLYAFFETLRSEDAKESPVETLLMALGASGPRRTFSAERCSRSRKTRKRVKNTSMRASAISSPSRGEKTAPLSRVKPYWQIHGKSSRNEPPA